MKLHELQSKDIVNVSDGSKLGRISDLEIDTTNGTILSFTLQQNLRFSNLFSNNNSIRLTWDQIIKIGEEVIIVNTTK